MPGRYKKAECRRRLLMASLITCLFCYPLLSTSFLHIGHDHFFHLSRIAGLAEAMQRGDLLPILYPLKNNGFGYASPVFYNDLLLTPFALLYLLGVPLSVSYKCSVFTAVFLSYLSMYKLTREITQKEAASHISAAAYTFANYKMIDVYTRGALGEVTAFIFLPWVILGLYRIFVKKESGSALTFGLTGLILSHNLSFLFGMTLTLITLITYRRICTQKQMRSLIRALVLSFLLTVWFTLPMIEQLKAQTLIVHYYAAASDLSAQAMSVTDLFADTLRTPADFLTNTGLFLLVLTAVSLLPRYREKDRFLRMLRYTGVICLLLPLRYVPWKYLVFLRVLQFPWRFMVPAVTLLSLNAGILCSKIQRPAVLLAAGMFLFAEHAYHLYTMQDPSWNFGISADTAYEDITSGKIIDPYYSASYMRVELAGGDYLPLHTVDFRTYPAVITDDAGMPTGISYEKEGSVLRFTVSEENIGRTLHLPLTWYKGYQAQISASDHTERIPVMRSEQALVSITAEKAGVCTVMYKPTGLAVFCRMISLCTVLFLLYRRISSRSSGTTVNPSK